MTPPYILLLTALISSISGILGIIIGFYLRREDEFRKRWVSYLEEMSTRAAVMCECFYGKKEEGVCDFSAGELKAVPFWEHEGAAYEKVVGWNAEMLNLWEKRNRGDFQAPYLDRLREIQTSVVKLLMQRRRLFSISQKKTA